ncbi:hypothetical protein N7533_007196 [Penicillium manginii]|uniref:uncharacterized protein n=1 Tax=Penicillium manginii TaxID=203109 RepID=UPI002547495E|nr:uncharacterized protein N7533_007196 [Penicillium manginii]KAJ5750168.1 hypothetical protein N7533_007196 [Penicillium manginii]
MSDIETDERVTLLLVGDVECGKSTFLSRLKSGRRPTPSQTGAATYSLPETLRDSDQPFIYDIRFAKKKFVLELYDTASPNQHWTSLQPDVVVIAFDVSNRNTLDGLKEAYRIAQELRCDRYAECSAVTGELLAETFEDLARMAGMATTTKGAQTAGGCNIL